MSIIIYLFFQFQLYYFNEIFVVFFFRVNNFFIIIYFVYHVNFDFDYFIFCLTHYQKAINNDIKKYLLLLFAFSFCL